MAQQLRIVNYQPQEWKCANPGCNNIISNVGQKNKPRKYCDADCKPRIKNDYQRRIYIPVILLPRRCNFCYTLFTPMGSTKTKYCSQPCRWRYRRGLTVRVSCSICGSPMLPNGKMKYCTRRCTILGSYLIKLKMYGVVR